MPVWYVISVICFDKVKMFDQYTFYNLVLVVISFIINNPLLNTALFTNSMAICVSFHSILLHDSNAFYMMSHHNGTDPCIWYLLNFIGHILPIPVLYYRSIELYMGLIAGFTSCLHHLTWAFVRHKGLILNGAYLSKPPHVWYMLWTYAVLTHIMTGALLQLAS